MMRRAIIAIGLVAAAGPATADCANDIAELRESLVACYQRRDPAADFYSDLQARLKDTGGLRVSVPAGAPSRQGFVDLFQDSAVLADGVAFQAIFAACEKARPELVKRYDTCNTDRFATAGVYAVACHDADAAPGSQPAAGQTTRTVRGRALACNR
jgi:hypothetical protein